MGQPEKKGIYHPRMLYGPVARMERYVNQHELGFLVFVKKQQARRIEQLFLKGEKGRSKFRGLLAHKIEFDPRFAELMPSNHHSSTEIFNSLTALGAPLECFILSEHKERDGRQMLLSHALAASVGSGFGCYISCIPGKLGYFEAEGKGERYLLRVK